MLVLVYTCQNTTLLEITGQGSIQYGNNNNHLGYQNTASIAILHLHVLLMRIRPIKFRNNLNYCCGRHVKQILNWPECFIS